MSPNKHTKTCFSKVKNSVSGHLLMSIPAYKSIKDPSKCSNMDYLKNELSWSSQIKKDIPSLWSRVYCVCGMLWRLFTCEIFQARIVLNQVIMDWWLLVLWFLVDLLISRHQSVWKCRKKIFYLIAYQKNQLWVEW